MILGEGLHHADSKLLGSTVGHHVHERSLVPLADLNQVAKVHVGCSQAYSSNLRIDPLDTGVVIGDELLDHVQTSVLEIFIGVGDNLLDFLQYVDSDVLVAVGLEDFSRNFFAFKAIGVNEVAKFTASAPVWPMVVAARNCSEVARLDQHVLINDDLLLSKLRHLGFPLLVGFFELLDGVIGKANEHIRRLSCSLFKQDHYAFSLL